MPGVLHTPSAAIAVFEREPYWAPELSRQFADGSVLVRTCTRLDDVDAMLVEWPRSLCVIEFEAAPTAILNWFAARADSKPALVFAVRSAAPLEWILREAGATSFRSELVSGRALAMQCRRLLSGSA
jgi:hypothetical protein